MFLLDGKETGSLGVWEEREPGLHLGGTRRCSPHTYPRNGQSTVDVVKVTM